jgi:hypothetical protein
MLPANGEDLAAVEKKRTQGTAQRQGQPNPSRERTSKSQLALLKEKGLVLEQELKQRVHELQKDVGEAIEVRVEPAAARGLPNASLNR